MSFVSANEKPDQLRGPLKKSKDGKLNLPNLDKNPWTQKLKNGRLKHLPSDCAFDETQHPTIKQLMAYVSDAMLDVIDNINNSTETLNKFKTTNANHQGGGPATDTSSAAFLPSSLRNKMPLHIPNLIKNDSRLGHLLTKCTAEEGKAVAAHQAYQHQMAEYAKRLAELKLEGHIFLLKDVYLRSILLISEVLVKLAKTKLSIDTTGATPYQLAILAIKKALYKHVAPEHLEALPFLPAITKQTGTDDSKRELEKFWKGEGLNVIDYECAEDLFEVSCDELESTLRANDNAILDERLFPS